LRQEKLRVPPSRWLAGVLCLSGLLLVQSAVAQSAKTARQIVETMVAQEEVAEKSPRMFLYVSEERSERTGGHLWTERVAETKAGKIRMLIAEDGQALNGERAAAERARLKDIADHPQQFEKSAAGLKNDEKHAREMLTMLPKAFLLEGMREDGGYLRIDFRPDPAYAPQSLEERVIHGMTGSMLLDEKAMRLHRIEARLPADVSIGFGLLATIHAGSNFSTMRSLVVADEWKTVALDTDISGRIIFLKSIAKKQHAIHRDFKPLPDTIGVPQAVTELLK
jgi:hypothetical protein